MLKISRASKTISTDNLALAKKSVDLLLSRNDLGFLHLHEREHLWQQAQKIGTELANSYEELVLIGIGGSSLGPQLLGDIFKSPKKKFRILDNVDPLLFDRLISELPDLKKTAWLIVSKSGSTLETLALTEFVSEHYRKKNLSFFENTFIVSEPKENPLTTWAKKNNRPILEIPVDVGGRFSIFTGAGLTILTYLGINLNDIKAGLRRALQNRELSTHLVAHYLESFARKEWISVLFSYSSLLKNFGGWWQQLWAESLAKKTDLRNQAAPRVSTPLPVIGTCDQHSVLQQFMEGYPDKFFTFLRVLQIEQDSHFLQKSEFNFQPELTHRSLGQILAAEATATESALSEIQASTLCLELDSLSPQGLAELLMTWQIVVGALGEALNINAYNQPGVELGKKIALELLNR